MAKTITQYDLLISCPSDVRVELEIIKEVVESFNGMFGKLNDTSIITKHWSKDSFPESGGKPQKLLNKQFVLECDAAIAVFWTRFGTPTDEYGSGTEEEIEELIKSGKQVFLYFSDCQMNPSTLDNHQYQKVMAFRDKYKDKGIYGTYSNIEDFKKDFLNHLTLYFVRLLNGGDKTSIVATSKLSINGVVNGKVADQPVIIRSSFSDSEFIQQKSESINEIFDKIKDINLPRNVVELETNELEVKEKKSFLSDETITNFAKINKALQGHANNLGSILKSSKVEFSEGFKNQIKKYAIANEITINDDFFYIGDLTKKQQFMGGGPLGTGPSYYLDGSSDEKDKYEKIQELSSKIDEYQQYKKYFACVDEKYYIELALSNLGSNFDEDVDVRIFMKKGLLCIKEQLCIPGDDILAVINNSFDKIFKSKKTVSVIEYSDYPTMPVVPFYPSYNGLSYEDEIENNKSEYRNLIDATFCYDNFYDDEYDILCYNQAYIKQNTNIYFPSILVLHGVPDKISYEISSKHSPEIIKGELHMLIDN